MACDASFLKHYQTSVNHFDILHFKKEETSFYSVGRLFHNIAEISNGSLLSKQGLTPPGVSFA